MKRTPRARSPEEAAFLALGPGAEAWLIAAAAVGATRSGARWPRRSISPSCTAPSKVEHALGVCAQAGRFADGDLAAILAHHQSETVIPFPAKVSEESSLQRSTRGWAGFGR